MTKYQKGLTKESCEVHDHLMPDGRCICSEPSNLLIPENDCITSKCTYPNCQCPGERLGIITAGELNRKGISNQWLKLWSEVQNWYGDISKRTESQEEFLRRMQGAFDLTNQTKN